MKHPTEHAEEVCLMRVVRLHEGKYPELRLMYAIPNGGDRHKIVAARMKAEGVRAGVPDYCLPVVRYCPRAKEQFAGLYIELKSMSGYASKEQKQWVTDLRTQGYRAEVCRGWQQAWDVIREYLGVSDKSS